MSKNFGKDYKPRDFKIINPKKSELAKSQICANEVNKIMKKYNCFFDVLTTIEGGRISNQVLIKEIIIQ